MGKTLLSTKQIGDTVAFNAYRDVEGADYSTTGTAVFNKTVYNLGSAYNTSTGIFTAPFDGIYQFNFACYTNNNTGRSYLMHTRGGSTVINGVQGEVAGKNISATYYMLAGDAAYVQANGTSFPLRFYAAFNHNMFSGVLIKRV